MAASTRLGRLSTYPNAITLIRPLATGPFIWCCMQARAHRGYGVAALALFGLIAASDRLDGWVARRRREASAFGRVLDHLCDVGFILASLGAFVWRGWAPWWLPAAIAWAFGLYALRSWRGGVSYIRMITPMPDAAVSAATAQKATLMSKAAASAPARRAPTAKPPPRHNR